MNIQQQIADSLQNEIDAISRLLEYLEQEHTALANSDPDVLNRVVNEKHEAIHRLESISKHREQCMLQQFGYSVGLDADNPFEQNQTLASLWSKLVTLAQQCRDKNRINGAIVEGLSRQSRQALDILHGLLPSNSANTGTYDHTGHTFNSSEKRSLTHV